MLNFVENYYEVTEENKELPCSVVGQRKRNGIGTFANEG